MMCDRKSLFEDAGKFFDKETGVLEAPMIITVADQTRPVPFTVHSVVTNSGLYTALFQLSFICSGFTDLYHYLCEQDRTQREIL